MPPRRNRVQQNGESRNNDSGSSPGGSRRGEALTTEQIMQLVASTVEQVLARRGGTQPESDPNPRQRKELSATENTQIIGGERRKSNEKMSRVNSSSTRVWKRDKEYLVLNTSKCRSTPLFIYISIPSSAVALHQLVHLSLATQPKAGTRSLQANTNGWSREINQNDDALTNPNDIVKVTSASLPPAGSPVAKHYSQQPLAAGSIRNTQNAAFQLNETTSLHFYDWFPKPAAVNPADNSAVNSASAQSADNSADNSAANSTVNSTVNSAVNSALTNENSAFGDENPDLAHEFQQFATRI
ncbi:pyrroline-5-carboxylate reductase [Dorcoceras hygrometricum]|uniref:Pyrroline-5-carboxylate reductase n=1 Tax=Dorcoceras hygrometricum TaxID=472368 RepID=A0A2Z7A9T2_9LAMI|nr:pyrroline-5-carboxylate reductase [Dorcoceras hygrometricum]